MKISADFDQNGLVTTFNGTHGEEALEGIFSEGYFGRVYRTSLVVFAVAALLVGSRLGQPGLFGLAYGTALSLASLRAIELVVRRFLRPGVKLKPARLLLLLNLKLPLLTAAIVPAAWMASTGRANAFALVGGIALVHTVIILKAVGAALVAALPPAPVPAKAAAAPQRSAARQIGSPARRGYPPTQPEALPVPD